LTGSLGWYSLDQIGWYSLSRIYTPPTDAMPEHVGQSYEWALVVALNVAIAMFFGTLLRKYTGPGPAADLIPNTETNAGGT
jgi:hypothetical protein